MLPMVKVLRLFQINLPVISETIQALVSGGDFVGLANDLAWLNMRSATNSMTKLNSNISQNSGKRTANQTPIGDIKLPAKAINIAAL